MTQHMSTRRGDVLLMVGTRKGSFLISSDRDRRKWEVSGIHFPGSDIFHMAYDPREGGQVYVAANHMIFGPEVHHSRDLGETWIPSEA